MRTWLFNIFQMCSAKKGVSASQIHRMTGLSYKASWFACHRVREAMKQEPLIGKLGGPGRRIEADETFVSGKARNSRHRNCKPAKKVAVLTVVERDGAARSFKISNTRKGTLQMILRPTVDKTAVIMTGEELS